MRDSEEVLKRIPKRCLEDVEEYIPRISAALDNLEKIKDKDKVSLSLKALSSSTRLDIVLLLAASDMPVCLISYILGKDQSLISHHLSDLKAAGLVKETVKGKYRVYRLKKDALVNLLETLGGVIGEVG